MKSVLTKIAVFSVLFMTLTFAVQGVASAHTATTNHQAVSAAAAIPLACPPTVSEGSSGSAVRELQGALNELFNDIDDPSFYEMSPDSFNFPLAVDGSFGPQTLHAVIDFQSWNPPLTVDGIVGPNTWHVLHKC